MDLLGDPARALAFVTFSAVLAGTPGPSNALLTNAGATLGIRRGVASLLGQVVGMAVMLGIVTVGLGGLLLGHPIVLEVLRWGGAALICWTAWHIARAGADGQPPPRGRLGFFGMAVFQWVNPKSWVVVASAIATFLNPALGGALPQATIFAILFGLVALVVCFPWLAFGALLQHLLRGSRARRVLQWTLAVLLVASVIPLVTGRV